MLLFEDLKSVVLWLFATVTAVNALFLFFLLYRRLGRKRYYAIKDSARERYDPVITAFHAGHISVEQASDLLGGASTNAERDAVEELLLASVADADRERMSELLLATGYLERWAQQAFGRRRGMEVVRAAITCGTPPPRSKRFARVKTFLSKLRVLSVPRALAVNHLGWLSPAFTRVLIADALNDPSFEVRSTAVAVIGRNRDHKQLPHLIDELAHTVSGKSDVSLRSLKLALVSYERDDLPHFVAHLDHKLPRVRFFLVDAISQICERSTRTAVKKEPKSSHRDSSRTRSSRTHSSAGRMGSSRGLMLNKNDFSRDFYTVFLERLVRDEFPDVRARAAGVIRNFRDQHTAEALRVLLRDENEFVRLHAARACGERAYGALCPDLANLLNDPKWRVREAAARSLRLQGKSGMAELYRHFVTTTDTYASEQITDEIQRSGAIEELAASLISTNDTLPLSDAVCRKMVKMGKTSLLLNAMSSVAVPSEARALIMNAMMLAPPPEFLEVVQYIASTDPGPLGMKASSLLETPSGRSQAAGGGAGA